MTEGKRVLYSLLSLILFVSLLAYECTDFAFDQGGKFSTSQSPDEETEEDSSGSSSDEDCQSETVTDYFIHYNDIVIVFLDEEIERPKFINDLPYMSISLDTPFSPPELMI